jgi:hypothetical protein
MHDCILVKTDVTHTIGAEFGSKVINVDRKNVKLQIWDVCLSLPFIFLIYFFASLDSWTRKISIRYT